MKIPGKYVLLIILALISMAHSYNNDEVIVSTSGNISIVKGINATGKFLWNNHFRTGIFFGKPFLPETNSSFGFNTDYIFNNSKKHLFSSKLQYIHISRKKDSDPASFNFGGLGFGYEYLFTKKSFFIDLFYLYNFPEESIEVDFEVGVVWYFHQSK